MPKITPFLWFNTNAEEAANHYVSIFKNSKITKLTRYGPNMPMPAGTVMTIAFTLDGQDFTALNGGPHYTLNGAISFVIPCDTQSEVDLYWEKLSAGGKPIQCGWLTDKFGLTWQIVPTILPKLLADPNPKKAAATAQAMMKMIKLDIPQLQAAHDTA